MPPRMRLTRISRRRLRSWIMLTGVVALGIAAMLRGFGPYYLNLSPDECAGDRVVICTNHTTYRTLEHVQVTVTNRTGAPIVVEQDGDTGSVDLTAEWQPPDGGWRAWGLGLPCTSCTQSGNPPNPRNAPAPDTAPQRHTVRVPSGGSLTGDYIPLSESTSGLFRLVLVYAPTATVLHVTEDVIAATVSQLPEAVSLPASVAVAVSAPIDLSDNGDRFPARPLPA